MWKKSLKARLSFLTILPVMVSMLALGAYGLRATQLEAETIYDELLSSLSKLMLSLVLAEDQEEAKHILLDENDGDEDDEHRLADVVELGKGFEKSEHTTGQGLAFRIWKKHVLQFYSANAKNFGARHEDVGYSYQTVDHEQWRFYVVHDKQSGYTLEVAEPMQSRHSAINHILWANYAPRLLLFPLLPLIIWIGVTQGIAPLLAMSKLVSARTSQDLSPLRVSHSYNELDPLILSINKLFSNLEYALEKERRFSQIAAHELRTPIAILKTLAQTALKSSSITERQSLLEAQVQATNRAAELVDKLLSIARMNEDDIQLNAVNLSAICTNVVEDRQPFAQQKEIGLSISNKAHPIVLGNKDYLEILATNLIDNAIKYTASHGSVSVSIYEEDSLAVLRVLDNGPGVPEEKLPFITELFYRISDQNQQTGSGLGLALVSRIAELLSARLVLRNNPTGPGFEALVYFKIVED